MTTTGDHDRPRERLERVGPDALADHELVAIILGAGVRSRPLAELARDVLGRSDGVQGLLRLTSAEIQAIRGIGRARAAQLVAAIELGRRCLMVPSPERPSITSAREAGRVLMPRFGGLPREVFGLLALDRRRRLLRVTVVSHGGADYAPAHPRDVFRAALTAQASAIVLFHTHPSGDPSPSADDIRLTRQLTLAGEVVGIPVLDHLVVAHASYFSFQESGILVSPRTADGAGPPSGGASGPARRGVRRQSAGHQ